MPLIPFKQLEANPAQGGKATPAPSVSKSHPGRPLRASDLTFPIGCRVSATAPKVGIEDGGDRTDIEGDAFFTPIEKVVTSW
jgi:hypothetical protein